MTDPSRGSRRLERYQPRPELLLFDVNETLSDMSALGQRFVDVGAPGHLVDVWFAGLLRDGFALAANQMSVPFAAVAEGVLRVQLAGQTLDRPLEAAVAHVLAGLASLDVHPDVPSGTAALTAQGFRLATLSNGSADVAVDLLTRAGIRDRFERLLSVEQAGVWKPALAAYGYALQQCSVPPTAAMLVAVHPWDVDGASRAGLATAWLNRTAAPYPGHFRPPDLTVASLEQLAAQLG